MLGPGWIGPSGASWARPCPLDINNIAGPSNISGRGQPIITEHKYTRTLCLLLRRTRIDHSTDQLHPAILNHKARNSIFRRFYYTIIALLSVATVQPKFFACRMEKTQRKRNSTPIDDHDHTTRPGKIICSKQAKTSSWAPRKGPASALVVKCVYGFIPSFFAERTKWPPFTNNERVVNK